MRTSLIKASFRRAAFLQAAILIAALVPWFLVQVNQSINVDLAWLTESALRLLSGQSMSEAYYDTNPPLSVLSQIIPAALVKYAGVSMPTTVFGFSLLLIALSAYGLRVILNTTRWLPTPAQSGFIAFYLLANTIATGQYIGERDHYVILGLLPFLLMQLAITEDFHFTRAMKWPVLLLGTIAILIKPHYGFIPVILLAHRVIKKRSLHVFKDDDFRSLAAGALLYGAVLLVFFNDFLQKILPDSLKYYVALKETWAPDIGAMMTATALAGALINKLVFAKPQQFITGLFILSALCIVPFIVQGKGFFYHAIPALIPFLCACGMMLQQFFETLMEKNHSLRASFVAGIMATVLFAGTLYKVLPPNATYPIHAQYKEFELAKEIEKCGPECRFFMFNDMTEMTHQLAVYTGGTSASRFPSYWFLPVLLQQKDKPAEEKYAALVAEDFKKYDPELLIIGHFEIAGKPFDFKKYFSGLNKDFKNEMKGYRLVKSIKIERKEYFTGTIYAPEKPVTYDLYKKR
jgi:hypothetical protein